MYNRNVQNQLPCVPIDRPVFKLSVPNNPVNYPSCNRSTLCIHRLRVCLVGLLAVAFASKSQQSNQRGWLPSKTTVKNSFYVVQIRKYLDSLLSLAFWVKNYSSATDYTRTIRVLFWACLAGFRLFQKQLRLWLLRWSGFSGGVGAVLENVWQNSFTC